MTDLHVGETNGQPSSTADRLVSAVETLLQVIVLGRGEPVRHGVPLNQMQRMALRFVVDRPGLRFHELASALVSTKPTTSRIVASLRELNLINTLEDPADGRTLLIVPTRAGRQLALQRRARLKEVLEEAFESVSAADQERFIALLADLGPALRKRERKVPVQG